jgi:hypothetical protein
MTSAYDLGWRAGWRSGMTKAATHESLGVTGNIGHWLTRALNRVSGTGGWGTKLTGVAPEHLTETIGPEVRETLRRSGRQFLTGGGVGAGLALGVPAALDTVFGDGQQEPSQQVRLQPRMMPPSPYAQYGPPQY